MIEKKFLETTASKLEFSVALHDKEGSKTDLTNVVRCMEIPTHRDPFGNVRKVKVDDVFNKITEMVVQSLTEQSLKGER